MPNDKDWATLAEQSEERVTVLLKEKAQDAREISRLEQELKDANEHAGDFAADCDMLMKENAQLKQMLEIANERCKPMTVQVIEKADNWVDVDMNKLDFVPGDPENTVVLPKK